MKIYSKGVPVKKEIARRLARRFNESVANPGQEITEAQAAQAIGILVKLFGAAIVTEGGFELRGFAAMTVKQAPRKLKRNPRTGEVLYDEDGQPIYFSQRRVAVAISSVILEALNA